LPGAAKRWPPRGPKVQRKTDRPKPLSRAQFDSAGFRPRRQDPRSCGNVFHRASRMARFPLAPRFSPFALVVVLLASALARAEEIRLHDNERVYGLIDGLVGPNVLRVIDASGEPRQIPIEEVVSVTYRGRERRMIQSGTQEFRFVGGGRLRVYSIPQRIMVK